MNSQDNEQHYAETSVNSDAPFQAIFTYLRAQVTSIIATTADFGITILLKEIAGIWYVYAVSGGAAVGAFIAYLLNRNWVFKSTNVSHRTQAMKYLLVVFGSWVLNVSGVYALTEFFGFSYLVSKCLVAITVALTFNYLMAKRFVFV